MKNNILKRSLIAIYCTVTILCLETQGIDFNETIERNIEKVSKSFIVEETDVKSKFVENAKNKKVLEFNANKLKIINQPVGTNFLEFIFGKKNENTINILELTNISVGQYVDDTENRQWKSSYLIILQNGIKDLKEKGLIEITLSKNDFRNPKYTGGKSDILDLKKDIESDFIMNDNGNNTFTFTRSDIKNALGL